MYRIKFVDEQTKEVLTMSASSDEVWAVKNGFSVELYDVVTGYNGKQYITGYAPSIPTEFLSTQIRAERDIRITDCDWVIMRHRDEVDESVETTLSVEEYTTWLAYRKALRDLPSADGFPWDGGVQETPWPTEPMA